MDRKLQHKHHSETVEEKRDKRRVAQNGRKDRARLKSTAKTKARCYCGGKYRRISVQK